MTKNSTKQSTNFQKINKSFQSSYISGKETQVTEE